MRTVGSLLTRIDTFRNVLVCKGFCRLGSVLYKCVGSTGL